MATETEVSQALATLLTGMAEAEDNPPAPPRNETMIANVREALSALAMFREDLEDAMGMEVEELIDEYRELRRESKQTGRPISEHWYQAAGEQIEDLCNEYSYPSLLPPGWDSPPPPDGAIGGMAITPEGGVYALPVVGNDLATKPD